MTLTPYTLNPATDLELTREVPVAPALVWRAWTEPELIKQWFTPKPWRTTHCEIDLRPGGRFLTVMKGPDDDETSDDVGEAGCFLEIVPGERLVWTAVLGPDFRPQATDLPFTAIIELDETASGGTRYRAVVMHPDAATAKRHDEMGFAEGWGAALDQLVDLMAGR